MADHSLSHPKRGGATARNGASGVATRKGAPRGAAGFASKKNSHQIGSATARPGSGQAQDLIRELNKPEILMGGYYPQNMNRFYYGAIEHAKQTYYQQSKTKRH